MPAHESIAFNYLHKAKIDSGLDADTPVTPEGEGDMYYATDTQALNIGVSSAWVNFDLSSISGSQTSTIQFAKWLAF